MPTLLHPILDRHRHRLRTVFLGWLMAQDPVDVLDLGSGEGQLMEDLAFHGVRARGIENSGQALARAKELGRSVTEGSLDAEDLVIPSADWITIRHVLHHLDQPGRLLVRASAAVKRGIFVSEPYSATGLPMHAWTQRLEALTRGLDRRGGMRHNSDFSAPELAELIPADWTLEVRIHAPMTRLPADEVRALIERSAERAGSGIESLPSAEAHEAAEILSAARAGQVAAAGSLVIKATPPQEQDE